MKSYSRTKPELHSRAQPTKLRRNLLTVAISLFLSACVTSPAKDDLPASDLEATKAALQRQLKPRTLPNGKLYCIEDSATQTQHDDCAEDLQELAWLSERDKKRASELADKLVPARTWLQKFRHWLSKNSATR